MSHSKWRFEIHYLSHFSWHTNIGHDLCSVSNLPTSEPVLCLLHISWVHVAAASCPHHLVLLQTSGGVKIQHITQLGVSFDTYHNLFSLWFWQFLTLKVWMSKCELHVQIFPQFWSQRGDTAAPGSPKQLAPRWEVTNIHSHPGAATSALTAVLTGPAHLVGNNISQPGQLWL